MTFLVAFVVMCSGITSASTASRFFAANFNTALPVIGCIASLYLVTPLSGRPAQQYVLALILVGIGILLFFLTMAINRQLGIRDAGITDPTHLGSAPD